MLDRENFEPNDLFEKSNLKQVRPAASPFESFIAAVHRGSSRSNLNRLKHTVASMADTECFFPPGLNPAAPDQVLICLNALGRISANIDGFAGPYLSFGLAAAAGGEKKRAGDPTYRNSTCPTPALPHAWC